MIHRLLEIITGLRGIETISYSEWSWGDSWHPGALFFLMLGAVVFSGWTYGYGNLVIVFHGDGYFSLYGHNQRNLVEERQRIGRGDVLALVGESGLSSGPHLHFEIWENGNPVDPRKYIIPYRSQDLTVRSDGEG